MGLAHLLQWWPVLCELTPPIPRMAVRYADAQCNLSLIASQTWIDHGWVDAFVLERSKSPLLYDMVGYLMAPAFAVANAVGQIVSF